MNNNQQGESRVEQLRKQVLQILKDCQYDFDYGHSKDVGTLNVKMVDRNKASYKLAELVAGFLAASTGAEKEKLSMSHEAAMADDFQVPNNVSVPSSIEVNKEKDKKECHCGSTNILRNKIEIEVGDKQGSVAYIEFYFCADCGHRQQVDWFD